MVRRPATLTRSDKLTRGTQFRQVYSRGTRLRGHLMTWVVLSNGLSAPRLGIAASRKLGNSVVRNRAKRVVRELFRNDKPLIGIDIVVIPNREMTEAAWSNIEADYRATLQRASHLRSTR